WFIEVASHDVYTARNPAPPADQRTGIYWSAKVFRVDNDDVLNMLKVKGRSGLSYSFKELYDNYGTIEEEAAKAVEGQVNKRDLCQNRPRELAKRHSEFKKINQQYVHSLPPKEPGGKWETPVEVSRDLKNQAFDEARTAIRAKMEAEKINPNELSDE